MSRWQRIRRFFTHCDCDMCLQSEARGGERVDTRRTSWARSSDDPRVYADEIHQMDWSDYAMLVLDEQERQQVRRNGWRLFRLAACIVLIQLATAATITTLMQ